MSENSNAPKTLRAVRQGRVISDARSKSRTVEVMDYKVHSKYGKRISHSTKYQVHDEGNESQNGDRVEIVPCRPISKTKRFRLVRIVEKSASAEAPNA